MLDIPFCRKVLEFAENAASSEDFTHNQSIFYGCFAQGEGSNRHYCGTTACLAGIACMLSPEVEISPSLWQPVEGGQVRAWASTARELMGLSTRQAAELFFCMNNAEALALLRDYIDTAEWEQARQ